MQMCVLATQFVPKRECRYFSVIYLDAAIDADCKLLLGMRNLFALNDRHPLVDIIR